MYQNGEEIPQSFANEHYLAPVPIQTRVTLIVDDPDYDDFDDDPDEDAGAHADAGNDESCGRSIVVSHIYDVPTSNSTPPVNNTNRFGPLPRTPSSPPPSDGAATELSCRDFADPDPGKWTRRALGLPERPKRSSVAKKLYAAVRKERSSAISMSVFFLVFVAVTWYVNFRQRDVCNVHDVSLTTPQPPASQSCVFVPVTGIDSLRSLLNFTRSERRRAAVLLSERYKLTDGVSLKYTRTIYSDLFARLVLSQPAAASTEKTGDDVAVIFELGSAAPTRAKSYAVFSTLLRWIRIESPVALSCDAMKIAQHDADILDDFLVDLFGMRALDLVEDDSVVTESEENLNSNLEKARRRFVESIRKRSTSCWFNDADLILEKVTSNFESAASSSKAVARQQKEGTDTGDSPRPNLERDLHSCSLQSIERILTFIHNCFVYDSAARCDALRVLIYDGVFGPQERSLGFEEEIKRRYSIVYESFYSSS